MSIRSRLKIFSKAEAQQSTLTALRLETVRFRKLLENARGVIDLVRDGREKFDGEYILDRQYVISLVDSVLERLGMFMMDASILAPDETKNLFATHDQLKKHARALERTGAILRGKSFPPSNKPGEEFLAHHEEPEYQLLASALDWMENHQEDDDTPGVIEFVMDTLEKVIQTINDPKDELTGLTSMDLNVASASNRVELADLLGLPGFEDQSNGSLRALRCRPIVLLFIGAEEDAEKKEDENKTSAPSNGGGSSFQRWLAITDGDHVDLRRRGQGGHLRLEASVSGHPDSDFIFLYSDAPTGLEKVLNGHYHVEKTSKAFMAWKYNVASEDIEKSLIDLGRILFGPARYELT